MIRAPIRKSLRRPLRSDLRKISAAVQRFITELLASAQSSGEATSNLDLDADFRIKIKHSTLETGIVTLLGRFDSVEDLFYTDSNQLRLRINNGSFANFGAAPSGITLSDGSIHTTEITRVSGVISATTDGQAYSSTLSNSDTFTINALAERQGSLFWNGSLLDLEIEKAGTLVVDSPLDDAPDSPYFVNRAATLGSELWTFGSVIPDGTSAVNEILAGTTNAIPEDNTDLLVTLSWTNLTGRLRILAGFNTSISTGVQAGDTGTITAIVNNGTNNRLQLQDQSGGAIADEVTISVREIPAATPYFIKRNIAANQTQLYDQVSDGWTGPDFSATLTSQSIGFGSDVSHTYVNKVLTINSLSTNFSTIGALLRTVSSTSTYRLDFQADSASVAQGYEVNSNTITEGSNTLDLTGTTSFQFVDDNGHTTGDVAVFTIVSAKRFLEVA